MINYNLAEKVEVTTDKNLVNALLKEDWLLVDVVPTYKKEYLFLLFFVDESRYRILDKDNRPMMKEEYK